MICQHCGHSFEGKRADAKFCSARCRVAFNRNARAVTDTRNADAVTDTEPLPTDPAQLLARYEIIKITSSDGADLKIIAPRPGPEPLKDYRCPDCGYAFQAQGVVFPGPLYRFSVEAKGFVEVTA